MRLGCRFLVTLTLVANSNSRLMPEPLPSNLPLHFEDSKEVEDAYLKILEIERDTSAMILISTTRRLEKKLLRVRVLGYLIREAPSKKARKYVADDVNRCHHEQMIEDLGHHYYTYFIRMCMSPSPPFLYSF